MVYNSSINFNGHRSYILYFGNHTKLQNIQKKTVTVMLFFSDIKQYVPVKLCKTVGSIHLFQIYGQLTLDQITLEKNTYGILLG